MRLVLLFLLIGCATEHVRDTPQFRQCKEGCPEGSDPAVLETETRFQCFCRAGPQTAMR